MPVAAIGVALLVSIALGAAAQEQEPEPTAAPAAEPAAPVAIPLKDVGERAEAVLVELQGLHPDEKADAAKIRSELKRFSEEAAASVAKTRSVVESGGRHLLEDLEAELLGLLAPLDGWNDPLVEELDELRAALEKMAGTQAVWEATADAARSSGTATSMLARIRSTQREIDEIREALVTRRNGLLTLQDELVEPQASLDGALEDVRAAMQVRLEGVFTLDRPPLWSEKVRADVLEELRGEWTRQIAERAQRTASYTREHARVVAFQVALFLALAIGLRALRARVVGREEHDRDLGEAKRVFDLPTSMALVIALALTPELYPLAPVVFERVAYTLAVFPAVLIARHLLPTATHPLLWGVLVLWLFNRVVGLLDFAPELERIALLTEMLAAVGFLLWLLQPSRLARIPEEVRQDRSIRLLGSGLRVSLALLTLATLADVVGLGNLAEVVGLGTLRSGYLALFVFAVLKAVQGLAEYALVLWPLRLLRGVARNRSAVGEKLDAGLRAIAIAVWVYVALAAFGLAELVTSSVLRLLDAHLNIGAVAISLGDLFVFALTAVLSLKLARFVNWLLHEDVFPRVSLARGVPYAIASLVRYVVIFTGFMLALAAAGIQLSNLTVVAGGLGVGIGFGLQNAVNNFVSGLILLFERPVQVGDAVQLPTLSGEIRRIGIRSSVIHTWDGAEVIVPNGMLISDTITNWTLSSRERRVEIHVGVEYGTAAPRVIDLLLEVARAHPEVIEYPAPNAFFLSFGDSALEFVLRAWIADFDRGYSSRSELNVAIQRALAEAGIGVPFPQRDLHLRTVSAAAAEEISGARPASGEKTTAPSGPPRRERD